MTDKKPLIVVCGPTASGKTALAVELAKNYNGEVVSADSMQIYKGLNIATAKPTIEEMQGIVHHLIDCLDTDAKFSVADYVKLAKACISDIHFRGKIPIVCGGTGLYISSLLDNVSFEEIKSDKSVRDRLEAEAESGNHHEIWLRLNEIDPETAQKVHENNTPRVVRGLEVFELTGRKLSDLRKESRANESMYSTCIIGLTYEDRQKLYDRINLRVDKMIDEGLIEECLDMYKQGGLQTACQAIGYKELIPYFEGVLSLSECVDKIKQESRRYAKRQLTWFRRVDRIQWVEPPEISEYKNFLKNVENIIAKTEIM